MQVTVTTLDGKPMTADETTERVGTGLRIAAAFVATATDDETGIETGVEAHYRRAEGRYVVTTIVNRALRDDVDPDALRRLSTSPILQTAIPHCIAIDMFGEDTWTSVADLSAVEGRLIPPFVVDAAVKRGAGEARLETIEIIYGAAALAGLPPVKAIQRELGVPHRTASDWIKRARKAGRLEGMTYAVGRQAES